MGFFSFRENRCGICQVEFERDQAYEQHVEAVHSNLWIKAGALLTFALIGVGVFYYVQFIRPNMMIDPDAYQGAERGEHWHADYSVVVCGETQQDFLYSQGDVHTHGNGKIHIHPHSSRTAGDAANLAAFIESFGGSMTDTGLVVPDWGIDSSQECNGQSTEFNVYVNGYRVVDPSQYTPQAGDNVRFVIEPKEKESS